MPLLWEIQGPFNGKSSFLFGTMHVKDQRAFNDLEPALHRLSVCEALALELDLGNIQHQQLHLSKIFSLPDGLSLKNLISHHKYQKLKKILFKSLGFDLKPFENVKPFLITSLIAETVLASDHPLALDHYLWSIAHENNKKLLGIETLQQQLGVADKIPLSYQVNELLSVGRNIKAYRKQIHYLASLYEKGDAQKIYQATRRSMGKLRKLMLFDRNRLMADRIAELSKEYSLFAGIGAAHLGGEKGVIKLLKDKGFRMKKLK